MEVKRCISEKRETLLEKYKTNMNDFRKNGYVEEMALEGKHSKVKKEVLDQLERDIPKRGGELFRSRHVRKFDGSVEDALQHQLEENKIEKPFFFKELVALAVVGGVLVAAGPAVAVAAGAVELGASVVALTGAAGSVTTGAVNWAKPRWLRKVHSKIKIANFLFYGEFCRLIKVFGERKRLNNFVASRGALVICSSCVYVLCT